MIRECRPSQCLYLLLVRTGMGLVVVLFVFRRILPIIESQRHKSLKNALGCRQFGLAISHVALIAAGVTSARFLCRHVFLFSSILQVQVWATRGTAIVCKVTQAFDWDTPELLGADWMLPSRLGYDMFGWRNHMCLTWSLCSSFKQTYFVSLGGQAKNL